MVLFYYYLKTLACDNFFVALNFWKDILFSHHIIFIYQFLQKLL